MHDEGYTKFNYIDSRYKLIFCYIFTLVEPCVEFKVANWAWYNIAYDAHKTLLARK